MTVLHRLSKRILANTKVLFVRTVSSIASSAHSIATFKSKETLKLIAIVTKALVLEQQQQLHKAELQIKRELLELQSKKE